MAKKGQSKRAAENTTFLKIGDVASMVGISATAIRSWEKLGLIRPQRTNSQYRLYTADDVKLLKRARFLRRERGLNAPAIVESLRRGGDLPFMQPTPQNSNAAPKLGAMLRRMRTERGLSLSEVAQKAEISVGFLSAIERSHMTASVATLRKLARFYKINILDLFQPSESNPYLVRPADRKVLAGGKGVRMELLAWGNTAMEPHLFRIAPGAGSGESYSHHGEEFLHVIRGELEIIIAGQKHSLKAGDSLYFDSSMPHEWKNPGKSESSILWVNTPPTF
jgi:DNA-binding transcriptional MerR regulator/mannose-6-phosphate isomerase-like protein (cupin superfamily)